MMCVWSPAVKLESEIHTKRVGSNSDNSRTKLLPWFWVWLQEMGGDDVVIKITLFSILRIPQICFTKINSNLQPQNLTLVAKTLQISKGWGICQSQIAHNSGDDAEPKSGLRMWGFRQVGKWVKFTGLDKWRRGLACCLLSCPRGEMGDWHVTPQRP